MTALAAALVGLACGWALRGALDRAVRDLVMRVTVSAVGRDRMLFALKQRIEHGFDGGPGISEPAKAVHLAGHLRRCKARATGYFKDCDCHPAVRE